MFISARQAPSHLSLRKTPTRSTFAETPSSQDSLRIPLVDSPLPSPGLPLIVPRQPKKFKPRWNRRLRRLFFYIIILIAVFVLVEKVLVFLWSQSTDVVDFVPLNGGSYEIVGTETLPEQPIAIAITGLEGKPKWTVSIPQNQAFPLAPSEYTTLCAQCEEISRSVAEMAGRSRLSDHRSYYEKDPGFVDVSDAVNQGLLPTLLEERQQNSNSRKKQETKNGETGADAVTSSHAGSKVCDRTLTYVLQSEEAGLGRILWGLWMSYSLAQKEGRSFFVDDTNWAYGNYTTYFQPPPKPECLPAPLRERVPCPRQARHLVVSMATAPWIFTDSFQKHFEDRSKTGVERQRRIFSLLRTGYDALFKLADEDASYLKKRVEELRDAVQRHGGKQIGIHVRRGDLHPVEYQYRDSYIPLEQYATTAERMLEDALNTTPGVDSTSEAKASSKMILASDDPDVYESTELLNAEKAQYSISLATKKALDQAATTQGQSKKALDDNIGWEGGFFKDMFWSLGSSHSHHAAGGPPASFKSLLLKEQLSVSDNAHSDSHDNAIYLREFIGRAYLLDLAVLAQTDMVVCGVNSMACRLLAVMMGWDRAIIAGDWKNIDGSGHWDGTLW